MVEDNLRDEGARGSVEGLLADTGLSQSVALLLGLAPAVPHADHPRDDSRLFPATNVGMSVEHGAGQRRSAPRDSADKHSLLHRLSEGRGVEMEARRREEPAVGRLLLLAAAAPPGVDVDTDE